MLTAHTKQWEEQVLKSVKAGRNVFMACASQKATNKIAEFCELCKAPWKLYTGDKSCAKGKQVNFLDIDTALEGIQVVIATTCLTVAVDIQEWHCDDAYIYSLGGCDCGKIRELC
jgi:hypothetical protein